MIRYALCSLLCSFSLITIPMDISTPPEEQVPEPLYFVKLRVDNGQYEIGIPYTLRHYFPYLQDILDAIAPENNTLSYPLMAQQTVDDFITLLLTYDTNQKIGTPTQLSSEITIERFVNLANIIAQFNVRALYPLMQAQADTHIRSNLDLQKPTSKENLTLLDTIDNKIIKKVKNNVFEGLKDRLLRRTLIQQAGPFSMKRFYAIPYNTLITGCFSGDGTVIAWIDRNQQLHWDESIYWEKDIEKTINLNFMKEPLNPANLYLALNYTGSRAAFNGDNATIHLFATETGAHTILPFEHLFSHHIYLSNTDNFLLVLNQLFLQLLDTNTNTKVNLQMPQGAEIKSACFSKNDAYLYISFKHAQTNTYTLYTYDTKTKIPVATWAHSESAILIIDPSSPQSVLIVNNNGIIASCFYDEKIKQLMWSKPLQLSPFNNLKTAQFNQKKTLCLVTDNDGMKLIDTHKNKIIYTNNRLLWPVFAPMQDSIIAYDRNNIIQLDIYDETTKNILDELFEDLSLFQLTVLLNMLHVFGKALQADPDAINEFVEMIPQKFKPFMRTFLTEKLFVRD